MLLERYSVQFRGQIKEMKLVALAVHCPYVPPLHVERPETENSHPNEGPGLGPFRVNENFPFADYRLEPCRTDISGNSGNIFQE
jgi:hypothetical protein